MPIISDNIDFHGSGAGAESDPNNWLGGAISSVEVTDNSDNNLFDDVTGDEADTGNTDYRGIYVKNNHGSLTLRNTKIWIESNTTSVDTAVRIALALEGLNVTMDTIANGDTEPSPTPAWSTAANKAAGLDLTDIPFSENFGIWLERVVNSSAGILDGDTFQLKVEGDTAA